MVSKTVLELFLDSYSDLTNDWVWIIRSEEYITEGNNFSGSGSRSMS